ncbi:ABC transporter permease [Dyella jejuensis]|uniref:ABC transporter permease n=1 Tax=Dyella jejuensis TaxID=1432009 RepID=A0ABW8JL73_9GAMM
MNVHPVIAALRKHKTGTVLIALQIALTLAIVCNAFFVVGERLEKVHRVTGIDERDILFVSTSHAGLSTSTDSDKARIDADVQSDLQALRKLPDVADAYETETLSLSNNNWGLGLKKTADARGGVPGNIVFSDEHAIPTLGVKLIAGRNFNSDEVTPHTLLGVVEPPAVILTKHMADELFRAGDALGKQVYMVGGATKPSTIIGIVDKMESASSQTNSDSIAWNCILLPFHMTESQRFYVVRAKPGRLEAAAKSVPAALYAQDPLRVIPDGPGENAGVRTFAQIREQAYKGDVALAQLMIAISMILLAVTAAGIVGLTSFWVGQRHRQIGVRRALGATRHDILQYFLVENALISIGGVVLGAALAIGFNLWMVTEFEMHRLPVTYVLCGVVLLLLLGQTAVLGPAIRASSVAPIEATRSA